ncbi:6-phosphogluconolactonase [Dasania marina]|uniref:6-phosphogluconolactonase n=1 Tax=Dasania marina TaxID=471499 RepID=UPI0030DBBF55
MITEFFYPSRDELLAALVVECSHILTAAVKENGRASFLVSGGSTPKSLYQRLSQQPLIWERIDIALVDERWVSPDELGSNEFFLKESLLCNKALEANFIAMKNSATSAVLGYAECEETYKKLIRPFDLTILGMGVDGHTASLFPYSLGLNSALDVTQQALCSVIEAKQSEVTGLLTERMTLSLSGLLQSKRLLLLITGEEKLAVYKKAVAQLDVYKTPVSAVLQQDKAPINVYWSP